MKLQDIEVGTRVAYHYPGDPPRPGTITVAIRPGGMVTAQLDDGMEVTSIPAMFDALPESGPTPGPR